MHAFQLGQDKQHRADSQHDADAARIGLQQHHEEDRVEEHLAEKIARGQERVPGIEETGAREGQRQHRRQARGSERSAAGVAGSRMGGHLGAALRAVPERHCLRPRLAFLQETRLQALQQEIEELPVAPHRHLPVLLSSARRLQGQLAESHFQIPDARPGVRPQACAGGFATHAEQHLDEARVGEHEQRLMIGQCHRPEGHEVEHGRHLHGVRHVQDVLVRPQNLFRQRPGGVPLRASPALVPGAQEGRRSWEQIGRAAGARCLRQRAVGQGAEILGFDPVLACAGWDHRCTPPRQTTCGPWPTRSRNLQRIDAPAGATGWIAFR